MRLPAAVAFLALTLQVPFQPPRDPGRRPAPEPTGTATIRGHVVAGDTGSPVAHASVNLTPVAPPFQLNPDGATLAGGVVMTPGASSTVTTMTTNGGTQFRTSVGLGTARPRAATTDNQGGFEFKDLPAGSYRLRAAPSPYTAQYLPIEYGAKKPSGPGSIDPGKPIDVADGQTVGSVTIALPRGSVIAGRVTDETGAPLARVQVRASLFTPGNPRGMGFNGSSTDDRGQFRLFGLQPGDYVIAAEGRNNTFVLPNMNVPADQDQTGLLTTYYPGTPDETEAQRVHLDAGAELAGVDIRMASGRLFHLSGVVVDSQGQPARASGMLQHRALGASFQSFGFSSDQQGRFQMQNVPPGDYRLIVRGITNGPRGADPSAPSPEMASLPLTVSDDVDNIFVHLSTGATITGQIQFDGQPTQLPGASQEPQIRVSAAMSDPMNQMGIAPARPATVNPDLTFTLKGLQGEYLLRTGAPGMTLKAVLLAGEDITDTPHEFKDGERVTIILTTHTSIVQGTVADDKGAPATEASIVMFSDDKATWHGNSVHTRRGGVDQLGQFKMQQVLPGNYLIVALPRESLTMPLTDASTFELFAKYATPLVVGDGEQRTVQLKLVTPNGGGL